MNNIKCLSLRSWSLGVTAAAAIAFAAPATAQTPVKIGVLADMSGIFSDIGGQGAAEATKMAVEDFNKRPGADKFKIEVVSADPLNKPDVARGIARKWFDSEGVDVLVDLPTSAISLAIGPLVQELNKVALFTASGSSDITGKSCTPNSVHWTYDT